jgi:hypothetical protein
MWNPGLLFALRQQTADGPPCCWLRCGSSKARGVAPMQFQDLVDAIVIDAELTRLEAVLPPLPSDTDFAVLDRLLMNTVLRFDASGTRSTSD